MKGNITKLRSSLKEGIVDYHLPMETNLGTELIHMNALIGEKLTLSHSGNIHCVTCGMKSKKSYSQGHCFHCSQKLASCDLCIMKPETCHFSAGTCREPLWAEKHCMIDHYVYLSNTSGIKVGITRNNQIPTRWIDQGAVQGLTVLKTKDRKTAGQIEVVIAEHMADKTNWRALLKGNPETANLKQVWSDILPSIEELIKEKEAEILESEILAISFPIQEFPEKIKSYNLDKTPTVTDTLMGIKGQYLIFSEGVMNVRKYGGYEIELSTN